MELYGYDLDFETLLPRIKEQHGDLDVVGLQFPDGMRDHATEIAAIIEAELGCLTVISADPCYGACDLCDDEMAKLGVKVLIHFGHTEMPSVPTQHGVIVHFVPARSTHDISGVVADALEHVGPGATVALTTTAQHVHKLDAAREQIEATGRKVAIGRGDQRTAAAGQLLGCNVMAATAAREADCFLYIGSGDFHPLALALETQKPIIAADPYHGTVATLDAARHKILKQRYAAMALARDAESFGIIVSTKGGQIRFDMARKIRDKLAAHGKQSWIIQDKQISPQDLLYFRHLDCFVGTACPRVPIDDAGRYDKPFLTPQELDMVLGLRDRDLYVFDTYAANSK